MDHIIIRSQAEGDELKRHTIENASGAAAHWLVSIWIYEHRGTWQTNIHTSSQTGTHVLRRRRHVA